LDFAAMALAMYRGSELLLISGTLRITRTQREAHD
jgi:hypothetical protein